MQHDEDVISDGSAAVDEENDTERIPVGGVKTVIDQEEQLDEDADELDPLDVEGSNEGDDEDEPDFDAEDDDEDE